jgi:hypothetical protein
VQTERLKDSYKSARQLMKRWMKIADRVVGIERLSQKSVWVRSPPICDQVRRVHHYKPNTALACVSQLVPETPAFWRMPLVRHYGKTCRVVNPVMNLSRALILISP